MADHRRLPDVERLGDLLTLSCPYVVEVDQEAPGIRSRNALPWTRLFLVRHGGRGRRDSVGDVAGGRRHRLTAGTTLLMPPGLVLDFDFAPGLRMIACHFRLEWAPGCDAFAGRRACAALGGQDAAVTTAYGHLRDLGSIAAITGLRAVLLGLAARFIDLDVVEARRRLALQGRFAPVLRLLAEHGRADLPVAALARQLGLGREHFSREFRRQLGIPPKEYHHRQLTQRACAALLAGQRVTDVAAALGFSSESWFSRFFKARTGLAPSRFRAGGGPP